MDVLLMLGKPPRGPYVAICCPVFRYFGLMHLHLYSLRNGNQEFLKVPVLSCKKNGIEDIEKLSFYFMDLGSNYKLKEEVCVCVCVYENIWL